MYSRQEEGQIYYPEYQFQILKERQTEHVGLFNPVFIDDIIKQRNLSYLQHLCELCEKMRINPIWFDSQSAENKYKILRVYQLGIQYSANTDRIYGQQMSIQNKKLKEKKEQISFLKKEILEHKEDMDSMKKKFKRERLQREKRRARMYEQQLLATKNKLLQQLNRESSSESQDTEPRAHQPQVVYIPYPIQYPPGNYPPPHEAPFFGGQFSHTQSFTNLQPPPQQFYPNYPQTPENNQSHNFPSNTMNMFNANNSEAKFPPNKPDSKTSLKKDSGKSEKFSLTDSQIINKNQKGSVDGSMILEEQSHRDYSLRKGEYNLLNSNANKFKDSQKYDEVNELQSITPKKDDTKLARKSSFASNYEGDSLMGIVLGQQSNRDPNAPISRKPPTKTSIVKNLEKNQRQQSPSLLKSVQSGITGEQKFADKNLQLRDDQRRSLADSNPSDSMIHSTSKKYELKISNQGGAYGAKPMQNFKQKLIFKDQKNDIMIDSMEDINSPRKSFIEEEIKKKTIQEKDEEYQVYDDDFESSSNQKIVVRIKSSVDTSKLPPKYVSLKKGYFILKAKSQFLSPQPAEESIGESLIGSLKELTVRMSATGHKKIMKSRDEAHSRVSDFDQQIDMITMPENSKIARPSFDKKSTIRKTAMIFKNTDSFQLPNPPKNTMNLPPKDKINQISKSLSNDKDEIQQEKLSINSKQSQKIIQQKIEQKHEDKLAHLDLAESHIMRHEDESDEQLHKQINNLSKFKEQSINIQIIDDETEQTEKELNRRKLREKIFKLIENKFDENIRKSSHFDTMIIKNCIKAEIPDTRDIGYEDVSNIFDDKTKELKVKLKEKKMKNFKKFNEIKENQRKQNESKLQKIEQIKEEGEISEKIQKKSSDDDLSYSRSLIENKTQPSNLSAKNTQQKNNQEFVKLHGTIDSDVLKKNQMKKIAEAPEQLEKQSKQFQMSNIMPRIPMNSRVNNKIDDREGLKYVLEKEKEAYNTSKITKKSVYNLDDQPEMAIRNTQNEIDEKISENDFQD